MTWQNTNGTLEHIDHAWMPQGMTSHSMVFAHKALKDVHENLKGNEVSKSKIKVDDRISLRIRNISGSPEVSYKGKNSKWFYRESDILDFYEKKPYVSEHLIALLENAKDIVSEGWQHQVAVLAADKNGLSPTIKPNVIEYSDTNFIGKKIAVCIATSINFNDKAKFDIPIARPHTDNVYFFDASIKKIENYNEGFISALLVAVDFLIYENKSSFSKVMDTPTFRSALHAANRGEWSLTNYEKIMTDKKIADELTWFKNNKKDYESVFEVSSIIRDTIIEMCGYIPNTEGIVLQETDGSVLNILKAVNPKFTVENHQKWHS